MPKCNGAASPWGIRLHDHGITPVPGKYEDGRVGRLESLAVSREAPPGGRGLAQRQLGPSVGDTGNRRGGRAATALQLKDDDNDHQVATLETLDRQTDRRKRRHAPELQRRSAGYGQCLAHNRPGVCMTKNKRQMKIDQLMMETKA